MTEVIDKDITPPPTVIVIDGKPRPSCHPQAELDVRRLVGPDTAIYTAVDLEQAGTDEQGSQSPPTLWVSYVKTYDAVDSGAYQVTCAMCGQTIDIEVEEGA